MKKKIFKIILISIAVLFSESLLAQPPGPGGNNDTEDPPCWPPPCEVPIDGGLSFLLAAGIAYGGKKAYDIAKEEKDQK